MTGSGEHTQPLPRAATLRGQQSSQVYCRPLGWFLDSPWLDFTPLGYLGVRHLAWRKAFCWFRLLGLPSCRYHGRISKRLATQEHQWVRQLEGSGKESWATPGHLQDSGRRSGAGDGCQGSCLILEIKSVLKLWRGSRQGFNSSASSLVDQSQPDYLYLEALVDRGLQLSSITTPSGASLELKQAETFHSGFGFLKKYIESNIGP